MEDEKEGRLARAKRHLNENKKVYIVGVGCFATGYLLRQPRVITIINEAAPAIAPVFNNHNIGNVLNSTVNLGGPMTKLVKCLETDEMWETVTEAAEAAGTSLSYMSRHLNGHKTDVFGQHYKIVGLGTTN